jgi:hypothetical protein
MSNSATNLSINLYRSTAPAPSEPEPSPFPILPTRRTDPVQPTSTPHARRSNLHSSSHPTASAPSPAVSSLGGFRMPAAPGRSTVVSGRHPKTFTNVAVQLVLSWSPENRMAPARFGRRVAQRKSRVRPTTCRPASISGEATLRTLKRGTDGVRLAIGSNKSQAAAGNGCAS